MILNMPYLLRCERPMPNDKSEVYFRPGGWTLENAEAERDAAQKAWPHINFKIVKDETTYTKIN